MFSKRDILAVGFGLQQIFSKDSWPLEKIYCKTSPTFGQKSLIVLSPDFAMQNPPKPFGLGQLIKSRRDLITLVEVNLDSLVHIFVLTDSDVVASFIEKSRLKTYSLAPPALDDVAYSIQNTKKA